MQWLIIDCTSSLCTHPIHSHPAILTTFSDLYIPPRTLPIGLYQLTFTATMNVSSSPSSFVSAYIHITSSAIAANLVPLGTSMITHGHTKPLHFNPGLYSIDYDQLFFNASVSYSLSYSEIIHESHGSFALGLDLCLLLSYLWIIDISSNRRNVVNDR